MKTMLSHFIENTPQLEDEEIPSKNTAEFVDFVVQKLAALAAEKNWRKDFVDLTNRSILFSKKENTHPLVILRQALDDKTIKAIFCMKGGWGCARILDKINYEQIKNNPKILIGFSDITSLLIAITTKTGLVTFHGPVGNSGWNDYTKNVFNEVCIKGSVYSYTENPITEDKIVTINKGTANGGISFFMKS